MYKRGLQDYMSTRRLAYVELCMVDMLVGWNSSSGLPDFYFLFYFSFFFLARYHTGVVGNLHGHFEALIVHRSFFSFFC